MVHFLYRIKLHEVLSSLTLYVTAFIINTFNLVKSYLYTGQNINENTFGFGSSRKKIAWIYMETYFASGFM